VSVTTGRAARVVVGVDGSDASRAALAWATREAELRTSPLLIVTAWSLPPGPYPVDLDVAEFVNDANALLDRSVAEARSIAGRMMEPLVRAVRDDPRSGLLDIVNEDDLLVIGARGRGVLAALLLGSVASYCVRHAPCPVLVVPASSPR